MNQKQTLAAVEAMLFACGDPIGADKLAQAVQLPQSSVDAALETLHTRYQREDSGLCLLHLNTRWQLHCLCQLIGSYGIAAGKKQIGRAHV